MAERQIKFGISFDVNKSGLDSLAQQLQDIQNMSVQSMQAINQGLSFQEAETQLDEVKESANEVYQALQRSFNADLGTVNITKFNQELNKLDLNKIYTQFSSIGTAGQNAFRTLTAQVLSTNTELQRSKTILDSMAETMGNTVKWGIASSAMNKLTGSVQEAYGYVKNLDTSLNNIRIVTEKSAEDMAAFAESANTAAKALGSSTTDYTNAALIYYQQGLSDEEVQARTEATIKTANVTGQSAEEVSEQLTAVWNGYQVTTENAESSIDILAAVAANSAANLEELSTGMAKVASSANAMGVSEEELTAQLATIISVTQQAPESVGTALRTIYARLSTISSGGVDDEDGATLTSYTKKMANFGISVLDVNGHLRDMGDVITEVGEKWDDFSREQQISLAQTMAGTRQYNYVLALFENWDQYNDNLLVAENSLGTLQGQQDIYMESTTAHLEQLNAAWEDVFDSLLSGSDINALVDIMTNLVNGVADFVDAIGGGRTMLVALGSTALTVFSTQIGRGLQTMISNMRVANEEAQQLAAARNIATQFSSAVGMNSEDQGTKEVIQQAQDLYGINVKLTQEQEKQINNLLQEKAAVENTKSDWNDQVKFAQQYVNALKRSENPSVDMATDQETGVLHLDFSSAEEYSGILSELDEGLALLQSELEETADVSITKLTDSADKASEAVKNLRNNSSNYKAKVEELKNTLFDNTKTIEEVTKAEKELAEIRDKSSSENVKNQIQAILDAADAYQKEKKAQDELKESSSKVLESLPQYTKEYVRLKVALEEEKMVEEDATKSDAEREKALNNLKNAYHQGIDAVKQYKGNVEETLNQNYQGHFNGIVDGLNREKQAFDQLKTAFSDQALYTSLSQFVGGVGQLASSIMMIQNIGNIVSDDSLSSLEKMGQITVNVSMAFGSLIATVVNMSQAFSKLTKILNTEVIPAVSKFIKSLTPAQITGIVIALTAIVTVVANVAASMSKAREETAEYARESRDLAIALSEENEAVEELYQSYNDLYQAYKDTGEGQEDLEQSIYGVCEALGVEVSTLDILSGQYDKINNQILHARQAQAQNNYESAVSGLASAEVAALNGNTNSSNQVKIGAGFTIYDEKGVRDLILQVLSQYGLSGTAGEASLFVNDVDTIEDFLTTYEALNDAYSQIALTIDADSLRTSELYTNLGEWLDTAKEDYDAYTTLYEDMKTYASELAETTVSLQNNGINLSNISSFEEFEQGRQLFIDQLTDLLAEQGIIDQSEIEKIADGYLSTLASVSEYAQQHQIRVEIKTLLNGHGESEEDIDAFLDGLVENDKLNLLASIDIDSATSIAQLQAALDAAELTAAVNLDISNLQELYSDVTSILNGLSNNSTINLENYKKILEAAGDEAGAFFAKTLTGEYQLIGESEKLFQLVNSRLLESFNDEQAVLEDQLASIQQLEARQESGLTLNPTIEYTQTVTPYNTSEAFGENESGVSNIVTNIEAPVEDWLDIIDAIQGVSSETAIWRQKLTEADGDVNALSDDVEEIRTMALACEEPFNDLEGTAEGIQQQINEIDLAKALSYDNVNSLKDAFEQGIISLEAYNTAYQNLYKESRTEGLDSGDIEDYAKYLQKTAKESDNLANSLETEYDTARELSVQILRMNSGVEDLSSNWDDWADVLKNSTAESDEFRKAFSGVQAALADILDLSEDAISLEFVQANLDDIALAANGDADAIDRLRQASYEAIVLDLEINNENWTDELSSQLNNIQSYLDENLLEVGTSISVDTEGENEFIDSLNDLIDAAALTSDQVQDMMSAMGYNVTFVPGEEVATSHYTMTTTYHTRGNIEDKDGDGIADSWIDYEYPVQEDVDADTVNETFGIEVDTEGNKSGGGEVSTAPTTTSHVNSITKKASGSYNNYSAANKGGNASKSSSGGSSSTSEPNHEDYIEDEADRYHDINLELAAISEKLSRLQTQESKLVGQDLLDNLNDQLATLDDQIDATTRKLAIANDEAAEMRASLSAQGVTFDENGYITNYASIMQSQLDYVNSAIDRYNAMSAEEQDLYKDTLDAIKQDYSDFVQAISDYDDLISDFIPGLEDDIQSALDQEIELQIEKFTAEVEIRLDMREAEQDWDEFYRKVILGLSDDDIMGNAVQNLADLVSYFNTLGSDITSATADNLSDWISQIEDAIASGGTGSIQALTDQVNATLDQLAQMDATGWASAYGDNRAQALEDLQTYYTELMNQLEDVQDLINDIEDSYLDMIDEAVDAFDEQVDQYEYINDLLNHDINLVSLLYGDDAYEQMSRYYEQIEKNNNEELDFLRQRVLYAQQMMEAETDDDARKKWEEEWENALSDLNDKVEDSVQNIIDKYVNAIEEIINALNDSVTNGLGLDYVGEEWDLMNQEADIYLDTINSLYAIQDLENKYLNAINDTDDIYAQQRLADIMAEQVAYLQDKEYLTQYDVDRAELQYEIALKQIALEEAQQNKNSMRLRRDSQGNYTYQYVSDENAVAEAQQDLLDLQNQLYNFDKNAYKENLDDLYSLWEEYIQKLEELYVDQTLTDEERQEQLYLLQQYYGDMINALIRENNYIRTNLTESATDELAALYGIDVQNFRDMTDEEIDALMTSLVPQWSSGVQEMADTFAGNGGFIPTCEEAFKDLEQATIDYEDSLDDLAAAAGIDFSDIANGYDSVIEEVNGLIEENDVLIDQYADQITAIQNVISLLDDLIAQYKQAQSAAEAATTAAYSYWQQTQASSADAFANDNGSSSSKSSSSSSSSSSGSSSSSSLSSSSSSSGTQGNGSIDIGDKVKYEKGVYYYDSNGSNPSGSQHQGEYVYITNYKSGKTKPIHISTGSSLGSGDLGWLEKDQISGYDTGGYTGEWDNSSNGEGALAVLHQKELVLNQTDTDNLLTAVGLVRNMASMLSALDASVFGQIASLASNLELGSSFEGSNNTIEQDVHIDATFPNVTNSHEIEDAFNNLVNIASQHAYNTIR